MIRQKFTSCALVFALAGVTALAGCSQQTTTRSSRASTGSSSTTMGDSGARTSGAATRSATTSGTSGTSMQMAGWPKNRSDGAMAWTAMAYPTGDPRTSALGIEKGVPREVRANQAFTYDIVVTNLTGNELTDVVVTDAPEANLRLTGSTPQGRDTGSGVYTWSLGSFGPRETKVIKVNGMASGAGTVGSCATGTFSSTLCSTIPVVEPKLRLVKTQMPASGSDVLACDEITYKFEVSNTGTGTINNVRINDPLPAGLVSATGGRTLTFDAGSLPAGGSKSFTARVKPERSGRFENRATATGEGGMSVSSDTVTAMVRQPALRITKTCATRQFIGRPIEYEITVTNTGDGEARNTVVEDQLPAGAQFVSASDGGRNAGGKVVWNLGSLRPNASKKVTMRVSPTNAGTYNNTAMARADCLAGGPVTDSCSTEVSGIPAILLETIDLEDPIQIGGVETYVITVTNQGSAPAQNVRIVCTLEPQMRFVSAGGASPGSNAGATVEFQPIPSLAPKAKAEWRVQVRAAAPGDVRFKTSLTSRMIERPVEETESTHFYE